MNMNEFKGTPGEWLILDSEDGGIIYITPENETHSIAHLPGKHVDSKANSKLIAAAPDLLEACIEALKELQFHNWQNNTTGFKLIHAINKALDQ